LVDAILILSFRKSGVGRVPLYFSDFEDYRDYCAYDYWIYVGDYWIYVTVTMSEDLTIPDFGRTLTESTSEALDHTL
jgi:hypothetical protein